MREKADAISQTKLTRREAYIAYITRVIPAVTYLLALTRFTVQQCKTIAKAIEKVILPQMGLNRNMPKEVLYGPQEYEDCHSQQLKQYKTRRESHTG